MKHYQLLYACMLLTAASNFGLVSCRRRTPTTNNVQQRTYLKFRNVRGGIIEHNDEVEVENDINRRLGTRISDMSNKKTKRKGRKKKQNKNEMSNKNKSKKTKSSKERSKKGSKKQTSPCKTAIGPLDVGDIIYGSTIGESSNLLDTECGDAVEHESPGSWYFFQGTGQNLTISTCGNGTDYDSQLSLFTGSCKSGLNCLAGNDDASDYVCGVQSSISWRSVAEETYFIYVYGFGNQSGNFQLSLNEIIMPPPPPPPPANDVCENAIGPLNPDDMTVIEGSTISAREDAVSSCGSATHGTAPGVWYSVLGTGNMLLATTLLERTCNFTTIDTQLSIFVGNDDCDALQCVAGNDDGCNLQSSVHWTTEVGKLYYILVHGFGQWSGDFGLILVDVMLPSNDNCIDAVPLIIGEEVHGTNFGAEKLHGVSNTTICRADGAGVWYSFVGDGQVLELSTCSPITDFDTVLTVYRGVPDCSNLECVDENDDVSAMCGLATTLNMTSIVGERYYILVSGFGSETGNFGITLNVV